MANQIHTTITFTRQDKTKPYSRPSKVYDAYVKARYEDTGKLLYKKFNLDIESFTATFEMIWANEESRQEFLSDPIFLDYRTDQKNYRKENNITTIWTNKEMDGDTVVREWSGSGDE